MPRPSAIRLIPPAPPEARPDARTTATVPWGLIKDHRLTPIAKLIATVIAGHMGGRLECYPSQETIGAIAGASTRTVTRAVAQLERAGWLEVVRRSSGAKKEPNLYRWRDPATGKTGGVKAPAQMEAALMTLHGPERKTLVASAGDTGGVSAEDTGGVQTTTNYLNNRGNRSRERQNSPERGEGEPVATFDWRNHLLGKPPEQLDLI